MGGKKKKKERTKKKETRRTYSTRIIGATNSSRFSMVVVITGFACQPNHENHETHTSNTTQFAHPAVCELDTMMDQQEADDGHCHGQLDAADWTAAAV